MCEIEASDKQFPFEIPFLLFTANPEGLPTSRGLTPSGASVDVDANASALRHFVKLLSVARMADCAPRSSGNREAVLPLPRCLRMAGLEARADKPQPACSGRARY